MDEEVKTEVAPTEQKPVVKKPLNKKGLAITVLFILSLSGNGYLYWKLGNSDKDLKSTKSQNEDNKSEIESLKSKLKTAEENNEASNNSSEEDSSDTEETSEFTITDALKENIKASFDTMNTQPMEGYMAPTVRVIIAASEGIGDRTPAEAVGDLEYFNSAVDPWDFDLPAAVLSSYGENEYYGQYFGDNTLVGKASSGEIVSMHFTDDGEIDVIFMMVSEDLF